LYVNSIVQYWEAYASLFYFEKIINYNWTQA
jgi:hypothetical protein